MITLQHLQKKKGEEQENEKIPLACSVELKDFRP